MAITGIERLLVDTNILVYAADVSSPFHRNAETLLEQALREGIQLAVTPQILREFMVAALRSFSDTAQTPYDDIVADMEEFRRALEVLPENTQTAQELGALVRQFCV